jgi:hypothetical protein
MQLVGERLDIMGVRIDYTGQDIGYFKVVGVGDKTNSIRTYWECRCVCGAVAQIRQDTLKNEQGRNGCGCKGWFHKSRAGSRYGLSHGMYNTRLYRIWRGMRNRCNNSNDKKYYLYGKRGICICDEWNEFIKFKDWSLSNGYCDDLSIDRMNSNGNYEPSNCRWSTIIEQNNNKRTNKIVEIDGVKHTIAEWSAITGVNYETLAGRVCKGRCGKEHLFDKEGYLSGSDNPNSKLNENKVKEIRELNKNGISKKSIAIKFKVSVNTVSRVCLRQSWQSVE